jgi:hypothetical protein
MLYQTINTTAWNNLLFTNTVGSGGDGANPEYAASVNTMEHRTRWLCSVTNLPTGLVTMGCLTAQG